MNRDKLYRIKTRLSNERGALRQMTVTRFIVRHWKVEAVGETFEMRRLISEKSI